MGLFPKGRPSSPSFRHRTRGVAHPRPSPSDESEALPPNTTIHVRDVYAIRRCDPAPGWSPELVRLIPCLSTPESSSTTTWRKTGPTRLVHIVRKTMWPLPRTIRTPILLRLLAKYEHYSRMVFLSLECGAWGFFTAILERPRRAVVGDPTRRSHR
jgi:hypothetical protein